MPNLGANSLNLILDIVTAFAPAILTVLAGWALWAYGWLKKKEANNAQFAAIDAVARQAVAAAEQAIAAADTQGKFAYAAAVLHARFPQLDQKRATAAIEAAVAALKMLPDLDSVSATATSPSVQPILDALNAPGARARFAADANAILQAIQSDLATAKRDAAEAKARAAAAEAALRTPVGASAPVAPATTEDAAAPAATPAQS